MLTPVAVYGLEVPCDGDIIPAIGEFPATFRITMAAIDPSAEVKTEKGVIPRATLKILREPIQPPQDDDDDEDYMRSLLEGGSDEESSDDDEAGPSDKKARKEKALKELMAQLAQDNEDSDEEMAEADSKKKGKKAAKAEDDEDSEEESDDEDDDMEIEEFVLCTLDPKNNYQVPIDITVGEDERVFFKVSGNYNVFLTGNYLIPDNEANAHREVYDSDEDDSENDEDYDLSPDEDELDEDSEDELDDLENPRVVELEDEEEEAPALVKKGKNKRAAEESLDEIMEKTATKGKKVKSNEGKAVAAESPKDGKSVKFAKNLEQGPTGSEAKKAAEKPAEKPKAALGVKTVKGVKIDDKKLGSGPAAKNGDRVGMRYIGKLTDGKVFDANKKGKPFSFKLGAGEVIKGWDIGIAGMQVGGERRLTVPANLAYGSKALPGIPSNSTLVFDVKMLEIK